MTVACLKFTVKYLIIVEFGNHQKVLAQKVRAIYTAILAWHPMARHAKQNLVLCGESSPIAFIASY